jgi:hypothetical protein
VLQGPTNGEVSKVAEIHEVSVPVHRKCGPEGIDTDMTVSVSDRGYVIVNLFQSHARENGDCVNDHVMLFSDDIDTVFAELLRATEIANETKAKLSNA